MKPVKPTAKRPKRRPVSMTSPAVALLVSVVFGFFCWIITSTMGGTSEYLRGIQFTIGLGTFGVYFSLVTVHAALEEWSRWQHAKRMHETGWDAYKAAKSNVH